jgi:hypothetical protein
MIAGLVRLKFVLDTVDLGQTFLYALWFSSVTIILPKTAYSLIHLSMTL